MTEVRAELAAHVLRVEVAQGDAVAVGATIVLLESMKMEIPVLAEEPGTVRRIAVAAGDLVQAGDLIAVID